MNGLYVSRAIGGALPKGKRYPDEPIRLYRIQGEDDEEEEVKPMTDAERFAAFAMVFNKQKFGVADPAVEEAVERHE